MATPRVRVVVPVRNGERFLGQALRTVAEQTYRDFELVVVDGHSTDRSAEIIMDTPGARYVLQTGRGVAGGWNTGLRGAGTSFIAFHSADDLWVPETLSVQIAYMQEHPECDYSIGRARYFIEPGEGPPPGFRPELLERELHGLIMEAMVVRTSVFERIGRFDESLSTAQDVEWCARAKDAGLTLGHVDALVLHKRVHGATSTFNAALAATTNQNLLEILRASIRRQRAAGTTQS